MSDTVGVMFDEAQVYFLNCLAYQFGDAEPILHLFPSDDTPGPTSNPGGYPVLSNSSYAPVAINNGYWFGRFEAGRTVYGILPVTFTLAAPRPFDDTITYGWWIDGYSPRAGRTYNFFGGRFSAPVIIPPAGMDLTVEIPLISLHDCGIAPPTGIVDPLDSPVSASLLGRVPQVGPPWYYRAENGDWSIGLDGYCHWNGINAPDPMWSGLTDPDMTVRVVMNLAAVGAGISGIAARIRGHDSFIVGGLLGGPNLRIYTCVSGSFTLLVSAAVTYTAGTDQEYVLTCSGDTITLAMTGVDTITTTTSVLSDQTRCGLYSDTTADPRWKGFGATTP